MASKVYYKAFGEKKRGEKMEIEETTNGSKVLVFMAYAQCEEQLQYLAIGLVSLAYRLV